MLARSVGLGSSVLGHRCFADLLVWTDQIPQADWDYPSWVNLTLAAEERQKMENERVICTS